MCVNSSKGELGSVRIPKVTGHCMGRVGRWRAGGAARVWEDAGAGGAFLGPVKGETGRVPSGRRRDFLLFSSWHGRLILVLPESTVLWMKCPDVQ